MGGRRAQVLELSDAERAELEALTRASSAEVRIAERARIVLLAASGETNAAIGTALGTTAKTAGKWRRRYLERRRAKPDKAVGKRLVDATRPGHPDTFDECFWVDVLAIATSDPKESGRPITHWTSEELVDEIVAVRGLVESIDASTVSRFLSQALLQPHRSKYWMNRKDDPDFDERAADVKQYLVGASENPSPDRATVSVDEKTGMQAKECIAPDQPMKPGCPARLEYEYKRHGTLVLFGLMVVNMGHMIGVTRADRTNETTADVLRSLFELLFEAGYKAIDVILDQLNTHWSVPLIYSVADLCGLPRPDDKDIGTGKQRRRWLSDPNKPIVFHYTPRHASWLNPIEIWFSVLARKVLRRGSFRSTEDLAARVEHFISYYNEKLAHPYRFRPWKTKNMRGPARPKVKGAWKKAA